MLQQLKLKNFQSHNDSVLEFTDGVNVIVGTSDSGKSAVLRSMNACITGELLNSYRTYDSKETEVTITVDGVEITRRRSDKENEYQVNESYYRALNRTVPEEVSNIFNMNDLNIQYQLDGPFLLGETAGEVAKRLNKAVNLDIIDSSIKYVNSIRSETNSSLKHYTEQLDNQTKELEQYQGLEDLEKDVEEVVTLDNKLHTLTETTNKIEATMSRLNLHSMELIGTEAKIIKKNKVLADLESVSEISGKHLGLCMVHNDLVDRIGTLEEKKESSVLVGKKLSTKKEVLESLKTLEKDTTELNDKQNRLDNLLKLGKAIKDTKQGVVDITSVIESKKETLAEITPDICPLCGSENKKGK